MKKHLFCLSILVLVSTILAPPLARCAPPAVADTVHRVHNTDTPRDSHQVLHPHELWRCGGESDEFLFGFIITAEIDTEGRVYLLDRWMGAVHVLGPDGKFLNQLSREGEGPGETNQPTDLTWLPAGSLGIVQPSPGRIVRIDRAGNPVGDIVPDGVSVRAAHFGFLIEAAWRGGSLAYSGSQTNFRDGRLERSSFLGFCDLNTGAELVRILEKELSDDGRTELLESDQYWIHEGRWCLGPKGKIYVAPQRDEFVIHVFGSDGGLERIVGREYEPWRRTREERDVLQERYTRPADEWGGGREVRVSADDPCISELRVTDTGELWVKHSRSSHDQAPGVFATWDVFATDGTYSRTVSVAVAGDPGKDRLLFLSDNHLLLIRGYFEASDAMWGEGEGRDQEEFGEIVLYVVAL